MWLLRVFFIHYAFFFTPENTVHTLDVKHLFSLMWSREVLYFMHILCSKRNCSAEQSPTAAHVALKQKCSDVSVGRDGGGRAGFPLVYWGEVVLFICKFVAKRPPPFSTDNARTFPYAYRSWRTTSHQHESRMCLCSYINVLFPSSSSLSLEVLLEQLQLNESSATHWCTSLRKGSVRSLCREQKYVIFIT